MSMIKHNMNQTNMNQTNLDQTNLDHDKKINQNVILGFDLANSVK